MTSDATNIQPGAASCSAGFSQCAVAEQACHHATLCCRTNTIKYRDVTIGNSSMHGAVPQEQVTIEQLLVSYLRCWSTAASLHDNKFVSTKDEN